MRIQWVWTKKDQSFLKQWLIALFLAVVIGVILILSGKVVLAALSLGSLFVLFIVSSTFFLLIKEFNGESDEES